MAAVGQYRGGTWWSDLISISLIFLEFFDHLGCFWMLSKAKIYQISTCSCSGEYSGSTNRILIGPLVVSNFHEENNIPFSIFL